MATAPKIEMVGLSLWLPKERILIVSDLHLGMEEHYQQQGLLLPKFQIKKIKEQFEEIFQKIKVRPQQIVIDGDLKHEFGRILPQEWKDILGLMDFLLENGSELILVKGNHDVILGPIAAKRQVKVVSEYQLGNILIMHGDQLPEKVKAKAAIKNSIKKNIKTIIIGHEHPAITLREKSKREKYKCFLQGKWKGKELIVLPSFNPLWEGSDILKEKLLSPFLQDLSSFRVWVVSEGEALDFGKMKDLR